MLQVRCPVAIVIFALITSAGACTDQGPTSPENPEPPGMFLSDPGLTTAINVEGARASRSTSVESTVAYISVAPMQFPDAVSVSIRNLTAATGDREVEVVDGGFDPVAIEANAGDDIELKFKSAGGSINVVTIKVPARRPPAVVRSNPPKGRVDVAINSVSISVEVVFSEPIDAKTLSSSSLRLLHDGQPVSGTVRVSENSWMAEFIPDEPLEALNEYELIVSQDIRDLDGEALQSSYDSKFTTGRSPCDRIPLVQPNGVQEIVTGCYVSVTRDWPGFWLAIQQTGTNISAVWGDVLDGWQGDAQSRWSPDGFFSLDSPPGTFGTVNTVLPDPSNYQRHLVIRLNVTHPDGGELIGLFYWRDPNVPGGVTQPTRLVLRRL
jgi:hypothetical protein